MAELSPTATFELHWSSRLAACSSKSSASSSSAANLQRVRTFAVQTANMGRRSAGGGRGWCPELEVWTTHQQAGPGRHVQREGQRAGLLVRAGVKVLVLVLRPEERLPDLALRHPGTRILE